MSKFPSGYMTHTPNSPEICAESCFTLNPLYTYAGQFEKPQNITNIAFSGVTQGNQCWCGPASSADSLLYWYQVTFPDACKSWKGTSYSEGESLPCYNAAGAPAFTSWPVSRFQFLCFNICTSKLSHKTLQTDKNPASGYTWCGGWNIMDVFQITTA